MYRKSVFLFLIMCATIQLNAQELYRTGYILNSPLDTIHGKIKYISYNQAAKRCIFKQDNDGERTLLPSEIYGYGIDNELLFISRKAGLDSPLFLEVLYQGSVSLYTYRETSSKNHFYLESMATGEFRALTEKTIKRSGRQKTFRTFAEVITIMLPKSELVTDEIASASLSSKSLISLFADYDERYANTQGIIYTRKQEKSPPRIGVFAGPGFSRLFLNLHRGRSINHTYSVGMRLEKEVSRGTKRLFIDLDLVLTQEEHNHQFEASQQVFQDSDILSNFLNIAFPAGLIGINGLIEYQTQVESARTLISTPISVRYKVPGKRWNATFGGGINLQYATTDHILVNGRILQEEELEFELASIVEANPFRLGIDFGAGVAYNARHTIFLDFRHSPAWFDQGVLNFAYTKLTLGVMLGKND